MVVKTIKGSDRRSFYTKVFEFLNLTQTNEELKLSSTEIRIIVEFMLLPDPEYTSFLRFRMKAKREVMRKYDELYGTHITIQYLYQIIGRLKEKGIVAKEQDGIYRLAPFIDKYILNKNGFEAGIKFEDVE